MLTTLIMGMVCSMFIFHFVKDIVDEQSSLGYEGPAGLLGSPPNPRKSKHSATVELVLELLEVDGSWKKKLSMGDVEFIHEAAGIRIDKWLITTLYIKDENNRYVQFTLTDKERKAIDDTIEALDKQQKDRQRQDISRALAQRVLEREERILAQPRLGDRREAGKAPVGSTAAPVAGYLAYDKKRNQVIQIGSGDSVKLRLDDALLERYSIPTR